MKIKNIKKKQAGYTLIEILVVISIITLLSTTFFSAVHKTRGAASDKKKIQDLVQINKALQLFYSIKNVMPKNYNGGNCSTSSSCSGFHAQGAYGGGTFTDPGTIPNGPPYSSFMACDNDLPGFDPTSNANTFVRNNQAYEASMQELVDAGVLSKIPHSPPDSTYCYYDTGHTGSVGSFVFTQLVNSTPANTPITANCAPLTGLCSSPGAPTIGFCVCEKY